MADRGTQTGGSSGGRGRGGIPLGAGSQTLKGALLVGAAVVLGIVLLQIVDPGKTTTGAARSSTTTTAKPHTTTTTAGKTTTTTAKAAPQKTRPKVRLLVLNAGAPNGSAVSVSNTLKAQGYTNQGKPDTDPTHIVGNKVLCKSGLTREATTLATLLGKHTTKGVLGTGSTAPPGSTGFDCVALIGAGAG